MLNVFYEVSERLGKAIIVFSVKSHFSLKLNSSTGCTHPVWISLKTGDIFLTLECFPEKEGVFIFFYACCLEKCFFSRKKRKGYIVGNVSGMTLDLLIHLKKNISLIEIITNSLFEIVFRLSSDKFQDTRLSLLKERMFRNEMPLPACLFKKAKNIICLKCGTSFLKRKNLFFRDLPSEQWEDFVELWSCHKDEFAITENLSFTPQPGLVIVKRESIVFHPDDICVELKKNNGIVYCGKCNSLMGQIQNKNIAIFKPSLSIFLSTDETRRCRWQEIITNELLYFINVNATYHFLIQQEEKTEVISISVLSCSTLFSTGHGIPVSAIKVYYQFFEKKTKETASRFCIIFPSVKYNALKEMLLTCNKALPQFYNLQRKIAFVSLI